MNNEALLKKIASLKTLASEHEVELDNAKALKAKIEAQLESLTDKLLTEFGEKWDTAYGFLESLQQRAADAYEDALDAFNEAMGDE